jgi:hypothetical protein
VRKTRLAMPATLVSEIWMDYVLNYDKYQSVNMRVQVRESASMRV